MKFIVAASLFAAAFAAPSAQTDDCPNPAHCGTPSDPADYENINISDFFLRKTGDAVQSVDFKLSGDDATNLACEVSATPIPSEVITCGTSNYRFALRKPENADREASLTIYHQTGVASGKWGDGIVPIYCHAGGDGAEDFVCNQVGFVTIGITQSG